MGDNSRDVFSWEKAENPVWDRLGEDENGGLVELEDGRGRKRRRQEVDAEGGGGIAKKGVIRYVCLAVDLSESTLIDDMRPPRWTVFQNAVDDFVSSYFDQNPVSQLSIVIAADGKAWRLTQLSGNPRNHRTAFAKMMSKPIAELCKGKASVQNVLIEARQLLRGVPSFGKKEVILLSSSLHSTDAGDVFDNVVDMRKSGTTVSVVGLCAEVFLYRSLAEITGGAYVVCGSSHDVEEGLLSLCSPPVEKEETEEEKAQLGPRAEQKPSLVKMGFPTKLRMTEVSLCACHADSASLSYGGFSCPQCRAKVCELPSKCAVCKLSLVASPHLARSYHHLYPPPAYSEVKLGWAGGQVEEQADERERELQASVVALARANGKVECDGCAVKLLTVSKEREEGQEKPRVDAHSDCAYICNACKGVFCFDCDAFVHESLHNCPSCS